MRRLVYWLSLLFIFTIPWEGVVEFSGLGTVSKVAGLALAVCWLVTVASTGRVRRPSQFHVAVFVFVLWNALSVLWSADPVRSIGHVVTWAQALGLTIILWDLFTTRTAVLAGLQAYVLGAYVAIGGAVVSYVSSNAFYTHYDRFSPGDINPDGFGFMVALGIPVAWFLAGSERIGSARGLFTLVNLGYVPAAFLGLALSGTRSAAIAAVVGMAFGLVSLAHLRSSARIAVLVILLSAVFFVMPIVQPLQSFERLGTTGSEITQGDWNGRLGQWQQGLASFSEHPLLGVGSDMYRSVNTLDKVAHNSFVSVLVELGLIGLALFGIILAIVVSCASVHPRWERYFWFTVLAVWGIGAFALTWEYRKTTWLFMTLIVASAALTSGRDRVLHPERAADMTSVGGA
jgi:O-antigen ligase